MRNSFKYCRNFGSSEKDGGSFHLQTEIIFKEENSEVLHSEHSVVRCCKWVTRGSRPETLAKLRNVVLEKEGKENLYR